MRLLSASTVRWSSESRAKREGREDGDVKEKSSNILVWWLWWIPVVFSCR